MMTSDVAMAKLQAKANAYDDLMKWWSEFFDKLRAKADAYDDLMAWWSDFYDQCTEEEYTDTGAVWDVMGVELDKYRKAADDNDPE